MTVKTRVSGDEVRYILCGDDLLNEVACFDTFLKAALVCRYLSGCRMPKKDQQTALAAAAEFDRAVKDEKIHHVFGDDVL